MKDYLSSGIWTWIIVWCRVKKSLPEKYQKKTEASLVTALVSATIATLMCYPLDTVRRQMQLKNAPYKTFFDAFPGDWILIEK